MVLDCDLGGFILGAVKNWFLIGFLCAAMIMNVNHTPLLSVANILGVALHFCSVNC